MDVVDKFSTNKAKFSIAILRMNLAMDFPTLKEKTWVYPRFDVDKIEKKKKECKTGGD